MNSIKELLTINEGEVQNYKNFINSKILFLSFWIIISMHQSITI